MHLGNLRTALLAWLFARSSGSRFLLRIEDLDAAASREAWVVAHLADLAAIGLTSDGPIVRQSSPQRQAAHAAAVAELTEQGLTYRCFCTRREVLDAAVAPHGEGPEGAYPGTCRHLSAKERARKVAGGRRPALRLAVPPGHRVTIVDRLNGEFTGGVDDLVLQRADGTPAYNLAVVVDDAAMGVGEVVRGDDLLASTPRQTHLASLLGLPIPAYAHVPLVLGTDGRRLAKRDGAVTLSDRAALGETPQRVLGRLGASLGLCVPGASASAQELLAAFDPAALPNEPWTFDPTAP